MKKLLFLCCILTGCNSAIDQCMRQEIFKQCMSSLPSSVNDLSGAIDSCESAAYYQSYRNIKNISKECIAK